MRDSEILDIRVLGGLDIRFRDRKLAFPTRHSGLLLAVLAMSPDGQIGRDVCAALIWSERGDEQARASLRQAVYHAQKVLASHQAPELVADRRFVALPPGQWRLDVHTLLEKCRSDPTAAADLCRGNMLSGMGRLDPGFEEWLRAENQAAIAKIHQALSLASDEADNAGRFSELERMAAALLRLDQFDESALRHLMTALANQNRRPAALKAFDNFARLLSAELDIDPEDATLELRNDLIQEPSVSPHAVTQNSATNQSTKRPNIQDRRAVSVLFLRPSVPPTDPEENAQWVAEQSQRLAQHVAKDGAIPMRAIGSSIACVFGAHAPLEQHCQTACLSAAQYVSEIDGSQIVCVVTGDVLLDSEIPFSGDATDKIAHLFEEAATLSNFSHPGTLSVSGAVARRLGLSVERDESGVIVDPVEVQAGKPPQTQFVGRKPEIKDLSESFEKAGRGYGQVVGISGDAGLGKSSLVEVFLQNLENPVLRIDGRERDAKRPFAALSKLYRNWFGVDPTEEPSAIIERAVSAKLLSASTLPALQQILGLPVDDPAWHDAAPGLRRRCIQDLFFSTAQQLSRGEATVLVVEDLHWIDAETQSIIDQFIDDVPALPLLVVATYRPGFEPDWINRSFFRLLRLAPLEDTEACTLLHHFTDGKDIGLAIEAEILKRCAGVPFFIVETMRALVQDDVLPSSIRDVLATKIHNLPTRERLVLQSSAVLGMDVDIQLLRFLTDLTSEDLDQAVLNLRKEEFLHRLPGQRSLQFRHVLLQETVYASIPLSSRAAFHSAILDGLLADSSDTGIYQAHEIAHHALHAKCWREAVTWATRAGDHYAELSSYGLAQEMYQSAVEALEHMPEGEWRSQQRVHLALKMRPVLAPLGLFSVARDEMKCAENAASKLDDAVLRASVEINQSYLFSTHGRLSEAEHYANKAISSAPAGDQTAMEARLALGQALALAGRPKTVIDTLEPTLKFWAAHPHERFGQMGTRSIWCHGHLAHAYMYRNEMTPAKNHAERAFAIASETNRPLDMIFALHRLGAYRKTIGEVDDAAALLEDAFSRAEDVDTGFFLCWLAIDLAQIHLSRHELQKTCSLLEPHTKMARDLSLDHSLAWLEFRLAQTDFARGEKELADHRATNALLIGETCGDIALKVEIFNWMAENFDRHRSKKREATEIAELQGLQLEISKTSG